MTLRSPVAVATDEAVPGPEVVVDAHRALGGGATGRDAQQVALDDRARRARPVLVDALDEVADDVAVGSAALPTWVSVAPVLMSTPMAILGSFSPCRSKPIQLPMIRLPTASGAVDDDAPVEVREDEAADQVAAAGDVEADLVGVEAVSPEPHTRDRVRAVACAVLTELPGWL